MACGYCRAEGHELHECPALYPRGRPIVTTKLVADVIKTKKSLQNRVVDAVEMCDREPLPGPNAAAWHIGYLKAKQDVLVAIAAVFAEDQT